MSSLTSPDLRLGNREATMGVFLPATPPSRPPYDDERRFRPITSPCEWVEDYRPGGYYTVLLGDIFNDGQYKVIRKLGEGSYSTVWLARGMRLVQDTQFALAFTC